MAEVPGKDAPQKVFLAHYPEVESEAVAKRLRELAPRSKSGHTLVESADEADLILIGSYGNYAWIFDYLKGSIRNELYGRYPGKSFTFSDRDRPVLFTRGIYAAAVHSFASSGRAAGGSYELYPIRHPLISAYQESDPVPEPRRFLCSFMGRNSHVSRQRLFALKMSRADILIQEAKDNQFGATNDPAARAEGQKRYFEVLRESKFCLCPRGIGAGSLRLFEAMRVGIAPVIVSDGWIRPAGVDWDACSITVSEADLPNLQAILESREADYYRMGLAAKAAYWRNFAETSYFDYVVRTCATMRDAPRGNEALYWRLRGVAFVYWYARHLGRQIWIRVKRRLSGRNS